MQSRPEVEFTYRLTGAGWSEARLTIGAASTPLSASYLGDLVAAAVLLPGAESTIRVSWAEEPGEFRWVLDRSGDQLAVRVLWFDSLWGPDPDEKGKVLLDATCSLVAFQRAIACGARAVLDEWGEAGYRAKWIDHDFPTATLVELESAH
ncbi:MAG: hypothetical protein KAG80_02690 [Nocardioides sp.]|nr:hypothetical protein [Nocardioides sp.]